MIVFQWENGGVAASQKSFRTTERVGRVLHEQVNDVAARRGQRRIQCRGDGHLNQRELRVLPVLRRVDKGLVHLRQRLAAEMDRALMLRLRHAVVRRLAGKLRQCVDSDVDLGRS